VSLLGRKPLFYPECRVECSREHWSRALRGRPASALHRAVPGGRSVSVRPGWCSPGRWWGATIGGREVRLLRDEGQRLVAAGELAERTPSSWGERRRHSLVVTAARARGGAPTFLYARWSFTNNGSLEERIACPVAESICVADV